MPRGIYFTAEDTEREEAGNAFHISRIFPVNLFDPAILSKLFAPLLWLGPLGGLASSGVAGGLGCEAELPEILLGERGLGIADGFEVLGFDFLVDFASVDRNGFGSFDTDAHIVAIDTLYDQNDIIANLNRFVDFSGKCKHRSGLSVDAYAVSSMRTWVVE
jgi:hypothetical protein